ncbi:DUF58 domain-containing protein [uncultured Desulfosarcina sp.]|uniref:DUF58 domain-containing protein n=1 Tax=uncultured Desulfosarcina sp. TaxID=218289 RepID=UPI0029C64465|nr:DUF58 domain-containing protein [uncultured Desulfosarcina sp.]
MTHAIARTFYRLVGVHTLPVTLGLRNIYILPTGYGMLFLAVLVAMLVGSINYNNNLGFLLTFLLGSVMLTAMMHTYGMLHGLRLVAATAAPAFAGEPAMIDITIDAAGRHRKGLRWYFNTRETVAQDAEPGRRTRVSVPVPTVRRGLLKPGRLRIVSEYPTGLFRAWSRIETELECLVYPKPVFAPLTAASSASVHGEGEALPAAGVDDFQGLRGYQAGDPPGRIHWQSYSRGQGLHVKTFDGLAGADWMLDLNAIRGGDIERKLSILCYHVLEGYRQRCRVGVKLSDQTQIPAGRGRVHRDRCLRALALYGRG